MDVCVSSTFEASDNIGKNADTKADAVCYLLRNVENVEAHRTFEI